MSEDIRVGKGFGYLSKSGKICQIKCFECGRENYAMAVSSGYCAWCAYDPNLPKTKKSHKSKGK